MTQNKICDKITMKGDGKMKFEMSKKEAIIQYLLEKIKQNAPSISKCVSEAFSINQNTAHSYINELTKSGIIKRVQRGKYELVKKEFGFSFHRSSGQLESDTKIYSESLEKFVEDFSPNISEIWNYAFTEMANNVIDHSEAEELNILIEQDYLETTVYIMDNGVGIFNKIMNYFELDSIDDAICELFKGKLTTDKSRHSGEGIFFTSRMVDEFIIISGGKIFTHNKYDDSAIFNSKIKNKQGTAVVMKLSNFSKKEAGDVFSKFENPEGDFRKTKIPLKNIFEKSPISRSQAKRVCNRFNEFSHVTIDFLGVDWMGQGFAHELFVVFKRLHPEIEIVPENMNESVKKMYNHVILGT